ncbi:hypothetical protein D8B26_005198 [Coccidioides posadasii str. Silveira]|nr:hypothetical protein D8B26_005198 [Coccidioides posadasii str. Silveira]
MESNDEISYRLLVAGLDSPIEAFGISEGVDSEVVKPAGDGFGGGKMAAAWRHALEMRLALPSVGKKFAALKLFLDVCVGFKAVHCRSLERNVVTFEMIHLYIACSKFGYSY